MFHHMGQGSPHPVVSAILTATELEAGLHPVLATAREQLHGRHQGHFLISTGSGITHVAGTRLYGALTTAHSPGGPATTVGIAWLRTEGTASSGLVVLPVGWTGIPLHLTGGGTLKAGSLAWLGCRVWNGTIAHDSPLGMQSCLVALHTT